MKVFLYDFTIESLYLDNFYQLLREKNIPFEYITNKKEISKNKEIVTFKNCYFDFDNIDYFDIIKDNTYVLSYSSDPENEPIDVDIYYLFTDGGSFNNGKKNPNLPSASSYGYKILKKQSKNYTTTEIYSNSKIILNGTNSIGELSGINDGLQYLYDNIIKDYGLIIVVSDSQYCINGMQKWSVKWRENNWKSNVGLEISNLDIWKSILNQSMIPILSHWIRGHQKDNTNFYIRNNNDCDLLCSKEIEKFKKTININ